MKQFHSSQRHRAGTAVLGLVVAGLLTTTAAHAAPVAGAMEESRPDPYELALRWTLASSQAGALPVLPALPKPVPAWQSVLPPGAGDVPDPSAYALMGLLLLGAGLAAHQWSRRQRGLSKKT